MTTFQKPFLKNCFILFVLLVSITGCFETQPPFQQDIEVKAVDSGRSIANATVRAEIGTQDVYEATTDANGVAHLTIDAKHIDGWAKVIVEADNYQRDSVLVKLAEEAPPSVVGLQPEGDASGGAFGPEPPASEATDEAEAGASATGDDDPASTAATGPLAELPAAERADYYDAKPEITIDPEQTYRATIQTSKGDIVVSLNAAEAPEHVNNFIFLSNQGFYDGLTFHRVEPGFVIQGGDPLGTGNGGPGYTVPGEFNLKHGEGALAMARLPDEVNPDRESSGSQFYITLAPTEFLDGQYSVFGQVEEGMDVVRSIEIGDVIERVVVEP
ncbi:MAG: peptidylprolyl isomerase [Anaerolineae bacterium]|nr:peptidylprolyl isomerase [Anaerolineae bacterium]